jgi:sialate O-acetylesterase
MVRLDPMEAGGPFTLTIRGRNNVEVRDVLVGEVWVCSGQSNMQWPMKLSDMPEPDTIQKSSDPQMRLFTVPRRAADTPQSDVQARWEPCDPSTLPEFSAVAYFFGRRLRQELNVPVGLISSNYGGTPAEAWTSCAALRFDPVLRNLLDRQAQAAAAYPSRLAEWRRAMDAHRQEADKARQEGREPPRPPAQPQDPAESPQRPGGLYNAMIAPLIPYAIRGVIWYQGESNAGEAWLYRRLFPAMIRNWRANWGQGDFPFLFVQLAPYTRIKPEPGDSKWAELREAQLLTALNVPNTAMAVITDLGDEDDIHPRRKAPVGERLALAALAKAYARKVEYSGPVYRKMQVEGSRVRLSFDHAEGGLVVHGDRLTGFAIAGGDGRFVNAEARVEGDQVIVWSPQVPRPAAVRFGWADYPVVNLYNRAGLPASPFRTDDFPMVTAPRS